MVNKISANEGQIARGSLNGTRWGVAVLMASFVWVSGCGVLLKKKATPTSELHASLRKPVTPEQTSEIVSTAAEGWWHGQGLGETITSVSAVAMFPPYALVLLGNGLLDYTGYETLGVSTFLGEETGEAWESGYDTVMSGPGRLTAALAGKEYQTNEVLLTKYREILGSEEKGGVTQTVSSARVAEPLSEELTSSQESRAQPSREFLRGQNATDYSVSSQSERELRTVEREVPPLRAKDGVKLAALLPAEVALAPETVTEISAPQRVVVLRGKPPAAWSSLKQSSRIGGVQNWTPTNHAP